VNATFVIAGTAALGVGAATVVLRRLRDTARLRHLATRLGWPLRLRGREAIDAKTYDLTLMGVGHSRRVGAVFQASRDIRIFSYTYETGTEADRATHTWRVATCPIAPTVRWALVTNESWLQAAAATSRLAPVDLQPFLEPDALASPHEFLSNDPAFWQHCMTGKLAAFVTQQSRERSWEIVPGLVAAFEPGGAAADEMAAMADQMNRFVQLLSESLGAEVGASAAPLDVVSSAG